MGRVTFSQRRDGEFGGWLKSCPVPAKHDELN
jgi:hypothetical protein